MRQLETRPGWLWLVSAVLAGCAGNRPPAALPPLPFTIDTLRSELVGRGVVHRFIYSPVGPWAIHLLEVELDRCLSAVAVKGGAGAVGREKTSALLGNLARSATVLGGVNADFFLFAPPGVPTGALIARGRVIAGPSSQPVLAFDSAGVPHLLQLTASGAATIGGQRFALQGWNRAVPGGLALFDSGWGTAMDTVSASVKVILGPGSAPMVQEVDTATSGVAIPPDGRVLLAGRAAPAALRSALLALRPGDRIAVEVALGPLHPREAVGGRPVLIRDSVVTDAVDTEGQPGFATGRHPRTAVGLARGGRRLLLVVVDGRQLPYSDGMRLRELASLLLALGARDALNLDGGGSTTMLVARRGAGGALALVNRPSDQAGERPVGDALAIVRECRGRD